MAELLGASLAIILAVLGLAHCLWAGGSVFPFPDENRLVKAIVGRPGTERLPSRTAMGVLGGLLFAAAGAAVTMGFLAQTMGAVRYLMVPVGILLSGVFIMRAIVGILPAFERSAPVQPYLTLNRRLYSPLSALLGFGFLALTLSLADWGAYLGRVAGG